MYNKKDILKSFNEFNYFIDELTLDSFIKSWKIDPIYEDEDGVEFFDNLSLVKLKKGISLKSQGYANQEIIHHINKILTETPQREVAVRNIYPGELQNLTIDVTKQTLEMLAETVAAKITSDIREQIENSAFAKQLIQDSSLKEDNENLAKKVEELSGDNKKLAQRIDELEKSKKLCPINFEYFRKFFN